MLGTTTNGAPIRMESKSGLQTKVNEIAPKVINVYCFIHRQALACEILPDNLKIMFNKVIKLANHIKSSVLNTRFLFLLQA